MSLTKGRKKEELCRRRTSNFHTVTTHRSFKTFSNSKYFLETSEYFQVLRKLFETLRVLQMLGIIPRPGIPDVCKEAIAYFCLNIQVGFKMRRRKKRHILQFFVLRNRLVPTPQDYQEGRASVRGWSVKVSVLLVLCSLSTSRGCCGKKM